MLWTEDAPARCVNGHELGPGRVLVGWESGHSSNLAHGHRVHICRECDTIMPWTPRCRLR